VLGTKSSDSTFDLYYVAKNGHASAIALLVGLYFLVVSIFFGYLAKAGDCTETNTADFLPKAFMLISGLGRGLDTDEEKAYCYWVESLALLIGVYFSRKFRNSPEILLARLRCDSAGTAPRQHSACLAHL